MEDFCRGILAFKTIYEESLSCGRISSFTGRSSISPVKETTTSSSKSTEPSSSNDTGSVSTTAARCAG